ncbi:MAG: hypothetical protein OEV15_06905, partial [Gallionella sp.]|nr:hypothetical protein [Gallionella sp.]
SNEQSAGIEQVNQAIIQMDEVTQQNAALVEEAAAAAEAMREQAEALMEAVSTFKLENGQTISRATAAKPVAQHTIAKQAAAHHPVQHKVAPPRNVQKIAKAKEEKNEDWKEF